jgi:hypothetical protein
MRVDAHAHGAPAFETILDLDSNAMHGAVLGAEENYCPDCYDCDMNCEECDTDH